LGRIMAFCSRQKQDAEGGEIGKLRREPLKRIAFEPQLG
jgi:hypothetical protein